jgi:hypothetical protein
VSVKPPRATRLLKVMHRSRPAELLRFCVAYDVLVVTGIRPVFQLAAAIELAKPKWLGRSQALVEKSCWPFVPGVCAQVAVALFLAVEVRY